jgi:signal transduction histidine kinase/ActR/RegA family two-component response regulator
MPVEWRPFMDSCTGFPRHTSAATTLDTPMGRLKVMRVELGTASQGESIWFGSSAADFPSPRHTAILRAAVSLCAAGLNTARIDFARARASRGKDEFLAMLGHELRNPLAPIVTTLEIIRRKGVGGLGREVGMIDRQVRHVARLVDDLLDVTRITRDKVELRRDLIDIHAPIIAALEAVSPLMTERRHKVAYTPGRSEILVDADPERLRQVFQNLLVNAAKYTQPEGNVGIRISETPSVVVISVTDDGAGLAPDLVPHIFDLFEQGPTTIDRSSGGLGIGLAIVRKLVTLHGGTVSASSQGPGRGSMFEVVLPKPAAQAAQLPKEEHAMAPGKDGKRVLIVDDNADALETITTLLELHGFDVVPAQTPTQAIAKLSGFVPEACVLDIGLPEMDGYKLASELRRVGGPAIQTSRFIALTGYGQAQDKERTKAAGFHEHLVKPVLIEKLLAALGAPGSP